MNEINKSMKLDNFRYRLGTLQHILDSYECGSLNTGQFFHLVFTPSWFYESSNIYVNIITDELDPKKYRSIGFHEEYYKRENILDYISGAYHFTIYSKEINMLPSKYNYERRISLDTSHTIERYKLIFWCLVCMLLDTNLYEQYIDYVTDLSDIFEFTEDMMSDWCDAAIYWLNGNDINPECKLDLKTDEGKNFFLNSRLER